MKFSQHLATNILLAGVLLVLVLIWHRMPPNEGDIAAAKTAQAKKALNMKRPIVSADIPDFPNEMDVNVTNAELEVNVANMLPVPVTIERH